MPMIQPICKARPSVQSTAFRSKPEPIVPQMAVMIFSGEYDIATAEGLRADLNRVRDIKRVGCVIMDVP
jgi:hypothetical protein